ncbi:MAG: isoprenylcysteine carboxylmethyltransferase family protein [Candidatus Edwardsbacteria bacterium]
MFMKNRIGNFFFRYRSYTPILLLLLLLIFANPSVLSFFFGLCLVITGELLRIWAVGYAGSETRTVQVGASRLVIDGPYAYLRNPLYLGNFILSLGFCIMAWAWMPWLLIIFILSFVIQYGFIIALEENHLHNRFGEEYHCYAQQVPRFVPRFRAFNKRVSHHFSLVQVVKTEKRSLQAIFLVTLAILIRWWLRW